MPLVSAEPFQDVDGGGQLQVPPPSVLLDLGRGDGGRPKIGHGGAHHDGVRIRGLPLDGRMHLLRGSHADRLHEIRIGKGGRAGHERDLRAEPARHACHRVPHLAGGPIGEKPDGIDALGGGPRAHEDLFPLENLLGEDDPRPLDDLADHRETPRPHRSAGELPLVGLDEQEPAGPKDRQVFLNRRRGVHLGVHRRGNHHGGRRRHDDGRQHVVRDAAPDLPHDVCRGRGDQEEVGPLRKSDMSDIRLGYQVPQIHDHGILRERLEGQGGDELRPRRGEDRGDVGSLASEFPDDLARLIGRDPPRYAQNDLLAGQHAHVPFPPYE